MLIVPWQIGMVPAESTLSCDFPSRMVAPMWYSFDEPTLQGPNIRARSTMIVIERGQRGREYGIGVIYNYFVYPAVNLEE